MAKYTRNEIIPNFTYATAYANDLTLEDAVHRVSGKTALLFLRYYGCPICQLDLHEYAQAYEKITATGGQVLVALQSDPQGLAAQIEPDTFPYEIICDPEKALYQMLSIEPAPSMLRMMSLSAVKKAIRSTKKGFKHGAYEGDEQQLPATFIMTQDRKLTYVHYGKDAGDVPSPEELASLMEER